MTVWVYVPNLAVPRRAIEPMVRFFERTKAAYQAFVEKRMGDLGASRVYAVFQKKKICVPGFC